MERSSEEIALDDYLALARQEAALERQGVPEDDPRREQLKAQRDRLVPKIGS